MLSFFKSVKNKPSTIKSTYYIREGLIHYISDLNKLLIPTIEKETYIKETESEIKFKNLSLVGLSGGPIKSKLINQFSGQSNTGKHEPDFNHTIDKYF